MANAEETPNPDIVFRGTDGNECEDFIAALRDLAFVKGKDEDPNWMLRYATTRLRGKAMRWHSKLDPSVRRDWDLFVQALFEEYPFVEERDQSGIVTPVWTSTTFSPALSATTIPGNDRHLPAALLAGTEAGGPETVQSASSLPQGGELIPLPRAYDSSLSGHQMGRLLVIYEEGRPGPHYISTTKHATNNIHEALIVTFIPSSRPHSIGCFNYGDLPLKLCVDLFSPEYSKLHRLNIRPHSSQAISLYKSSSKPIFNVWSISPDGTLSATLPDLVFDPQDTMEYIPSDYYLTTAVYVDISGATISFAKDPSAAPTLHPVYELPILRARLVFQPL